MKHTWVLHNPWGNRDFTWQWAAVTVSYSGVLSHVSLGSSRMLCWSGCSKQSLFTALLGSPVSQQMLCCFVAAAPGRTPVADLDCGCHLVRVHRFPQFCHHLSGEAPTWIPNGQNLTNKWQLHTTWLFLPCFHFSLLCFSAFLSEIHYCHGSKWFEWKDRSLWFDFLEGCVLVCSISQNKINNKKYMRMFWQQIESPLQESTSFPSRNLTLSPDRGGGSR